jgi:hypothetical protein
MAPWRTTKETNSLLKSLRDRPNGQEIDIKTKEKNNDNI